MSPAVYSNDTSNCEWLAPARTADVEFQQAPLPLPDFLKNTTVGHIETIRHPVFIDDSSLSLNWLYQWLNTLHWITKEDVILQELSFKEGDKFDNVKVIESERLLRNQKYLYDARIVPTSLCDNKVNLAISTRDTWSITPAYDISHNGDETKTRLSITESNFLGTGKLISLARASNDQRQEYTLIYRDPNVGGSHAVNNIEYSENSDGYRHFISYKLPFYSLESKHSYGIIYNNEEREDPIYFQQNKLTDLNHRLNHYKIFSGFSQGYKDDKTIRWRYGLSFIEDKFETTDINLPLVSLNSRKNIYPWLEFNLLENKYTTLTNVNSIKRTEDINLGRNFIASIGYSPENLSNDTSRIIYNISSSNAYKFDKNLISVNANLKGYWLPDEKKSQNVMAKFNGQYYRFTNKDWVFFVGASANINKNSYIENQLFLGGDTGLRGYPVRYQMGNKNAVINIEQRYYSDLYLWKLIRVGAAAYVDIGRNWGNESPLLTTDGLADELITPRVENKWLANVGFGLRLTPSRADANHVVHIDLAFPVQQANDLDSVRFMIQVKDSF